MGQHASSRREVSEEAAMIRVVPCRELYSFEAKETMALRPQIHGYFLCAIYAAASVVKLDGLRHLVTAVVQFAISTFLLTLLLLLLSYRNEIREVILDAFRACANFVLCLLSALQPDWHLPASPAFTSDAFRSILFQRPPPRFV